MTLLIAVYAPYFAITEGWFYGAWFALFASYVAWVSGWMMKTDGFR